MYYTDHSGVAELSCRLLQTWSMFKFPGYLWHHKGHLAKSASLLHNKYYLAGKYMCMMLNATFFTLQLVCLYVSFASRFFCFFLVIFLTFVFFLVPYGRLSRLAVGFWVHLPSVLWCCWLGGRKGIRPVKNMGGWWRWALISPDGVVPSRMVSVSASVNLPLHHKVQKFSSGTGSPGWSRKKGRKIVMVRWWW